MTEEGFGDYLENRYLDQVKWYDQRSGQNKKYYLFFQWGVILLSASLPVLIASLPERFQLIPLLLSVILAIGTTGLKTFKYQESWINYRTIAEALKKEKHFFDASLDSYAGHTNEEDKRSIFVERVESLISRENSIWVTTHQQRDEEKRPRGDAA
ncbi:MAG: DUF4231 domain-containing protein [Phycisphaerales bacterium]|nr:DUF4231 domain-containing protein [Phycisphaerales bacterium]